MSVDIEFANSLKPRNIQVVTEDHDYTGVPCMQSKFLAMHLSISSTIKPSEGLYSVTHVPTGCLVSDRVSRLSLACAVSAIRELETLNIWDVDEIQRMFLAAKRRSNEIDTLITKVLREHGEI